MFVIERRNKKMGKIQVGRKVLIEYLDTIERTIILIEDNKPLNDVSGFYNDELVLFELNQIRQEIQEVLNIGNNPRILN